LLCKLLIAEGLIASGLARHTLLVAAVVHLGIREMIVV
jgi:hypothetical protein